MKTDATDNLTIAIQELAVQIQMLRKELRPAVASAAQVEQRKLKLKHTQEAASLFLDTLSKPKPRKDHVANVRPRSAKRNGTTDG